VLGKPHLDVVCRENFERACVGRLGQRMGVHSEKEWPINILLFAVLANCLRNCQDVPLVEASVESGTPVTRGSKRNALRGHVRVGLHGVVGRDEFRDIHQN
jgi:hypothetical protein